MSQHSNQSRKSAPTSTRKEIRGANATYKASVQKGHEGKESKSQEAGEGGPMMDHDEMPIKGNGRYKPSK